MALMMKSCAIVVYHEGNKPEVLSQKILNLGFKLSKKPVKEGVMLTCEIVNPSREVLNQFLDFVENTDKDENYKGSSIEDVPSLDSFEIISPCSETSCYPFGLGMDLKVPNGRDVRKNAIVKQEPSYLYIKTHYLGGREGEEGTDETGSNSQVVKNYTDFDNDFDQGKEFECYEKDHERQHQKPQKEQSICYKESSERKDMKAGLDKNSDFLDQKATISKTFDEDNKAIDDSRNMVPYPKCGIQDKLEDDNKIPHKKVESGAGENCQIDLCLNASEKFEIQDSENMSMQKAKNEQENGMETAGVDCILHSKAHQNVHGVVKGNTEIYNQKLKQLDNDQTSESRQILKKEGEEIEDSIEEKAQRVATLTNPPQMPLENQSTFSNSEDSSIGVDSKRSKIICDVQELEEERIENSEDENVENDDSMSDDEDNKTTLIFSINTFKLASVHFSESKNICNYLEEAERQKSSWLIEINNEECVNTLRRFQKEVITKKVSSEKSDIMMDINTFFGNRVIVDHFAGFILLTALTKIHEEIKRKFPDLDKVSESAPSMSSVSKFEKLKEEKQREKTDVDSKVVRPVKASGSEVSTEPRDEFRGHCSNLNVKVYSANITTLKVDVIVNAANSRLQCGAGVAKAIVEAGGERVKRECENYISKKQRIGVTEHFASDGGNLPASLVYHALGPKWKFYRNRLDDCKRDLVLTILRCLVCAEKDGHRSIAFPSISSAYFEVPKDICAESYMKALRLFEEKRPHYKVEERLNEVHFVDIIPEMVQSIRNYFTLHWDTPISSYKTLVDVMDGVFKTYEISRKNKNIATPDPSVQGARSSYGGARPKCMTGHTESSLQSNDVECDICKEVGVETKLLPCTCCDKFLCKKCLSKIQRCPYCRKIFGILCGDQPNGYMLVKKDPSIHLDGYKKKHGTYVIQYFFNEISTMKHYRQAYLPGTDDGLKALKLLMLAFRRGLTFTKGTSRTTGQENRIVWNDIHHKTSLVANNQYGYPDEKYLKRLTAELQSKGVTCKSMTEDDKTETSYFVRGLERNDCNKIFML